MYQIVDSVSYVHKTLTYRHPTTADIDVPWLKRARIFSSIEPSNKDVGVPHRLR